MAYCGPICGSPCGSSSGSISSPVFVPYYRGVSSCGLIPAGGIGSISGIGSLSGIGGSGGLGSGVSCTAETPSSEIIIQPPPAVVTVPGPSLTSSNEPVGIAYINPCSSGLGSYGGGSSFGGLSGGYGRIGYSGYGGWRGYSRRCLPYSGSCGYISPCGPC